MFAFNTAWKTVKRKPFRAFAMGVLVMLLSLVLFVGAYIVISLQRGLFEYQARLGADIVIVPSSAVGHGTVDDILLQGITGNYYMSGKDVEKVKAVDGIESVTTQFFLTSAKASCCSTRVQIIGFDPETDFSIQPWIKDSYSKTILDGDVIAGANINVPADRNITFYGQEYHVAAQLDETGTGLDSAVYANMNTVKQMAGNAAMLLETSPFREVSIDTAASAVLLRVKDGYDIQSVTDDINIHINKVQASSARSMVSQISEGLGGVSNTIGLMVVIIWILAVVILIVAFALVSNERKKEFAVLRVMGASRKILFHVMGAEAFIVSMGGAIIGLIISAVVMTGLSDSLQNALGLPFFAPKIGTLIALALGALLLSVSAGLLTALYSAHRITKSETGLLLKENN